MITIYASKKKIWGKNNYFKKPSKQLFESLELGGELFDESKGTILTGNDTTLTFIADSGLIEYTYFKITTDDATYFFYKESVGGLLTEQVETNEEGIEITKRYYTHLFILDTGNTYEIDMLEILTNSNVKSFFVRKFCDRYLLETTTITEKPGYYINPRKQFGYANVLPLKAELVKNEMLTFTNEVILKNNEGNREVGKTIELESITSQYNANPNMIEYIKITYRHYAGTYGNTTNTIYNYQNRSEIINNTIKLKIDFGTGWSKWGVSTIEVLNIEIKIKNTYAIADTEGKTFNLTQDTPIVKNVKYEKEIVGDSSAHKFYSNNINLKSYCITRSNNKYSLEFNQVFNFIDNNASPTKYIMNSTQFSESQNDKNKNYYIIANQNLFNSNEAFASTDNYTNLKNKKVSYFIIPSMGNYTIDKIEADGSKTTLSYNGDEWGSAVMNNEPYKKNGDTYEYSPIVMNSQGIVNNVECSLPPELICEGKGYIAEQKIYDVNGNVKTICVPLVSFDYYNNKSISQKLINIDFSNLDGKSGTKNSEPYLLVSPQFINYNIVNKANEFLTLPLGNYNLYLNENGINGFLITTDNCRLVLDTSNFNDMSERSNVGDNFLMTMGNPVIFETTAFNNGYTNAPTAEVMGRQNFKDEQQLFNIETNMLKRDNNLSLGLGAFNASGDLISSNTAAATQAASGGMSGAAKGLMASLSAAKKFGESVAKLAINQQDFKDKMKKREIQNGISFRSQENKYNSIRLAKNTINIGAYNTNALSNLTDGLLVYKNTPTDELQNTIMEGIYDYGYSYAAVDYFSSGYNRQLYNVIQLDTSGNYHELYNTLNNNYSSIFSTKTNIDNFLNGLNGVLGILEIEPNKLDNSKNIELSQPRYTELKVEEVGIDIGETVELEGKLEFMGKNITSSIVINDVELSSVLESSYHISFEGSSIKLIYDTYDAENAQYNAVLTIEYEYGGEHLTSFATFKLITHELEIEGDFSQMFFTELNPTQTRIYTIKSNMPSNYYPLNGADKDTGLEYVNGWCFTTTNSSISGGIDNGQMEVEGDLNNYVSSATIGIHCCYTNGLQTVYDVKYISVQSEGNEKELYLITLGTTTKWNRIYFSEDFMPTVSSGSVRIAWNATGAFGNHLYIYSDGRVELYDLGTTLKIRSASGGLSSVSGTFFHGDNNTRTITNTYSNTFTTSENTITNSSYSGSALITYVI